MTNQETFKAFARNPHGEGKASNGTVYFRNGVLYSYRDSWPLIACIDGTWYVNTEGVSRTTSKHRGQAMGALAYRLPNFDPVQVNDVAQMRRIVEGR